MFSTHAAQIKRQAVQEIEKEAEVKGDFLDAIRDKNAVLLEELLKKKDRQVLVNTPTPKGTLPLNIACAGGSDAIVKVLLDKGADVTLSDHDGWTCLHSACSVERNTKVLKLIIAQEGINYNAKTADGSTPLHFFARYSAINRDLVYLFEIVVSSGGDVNAQNNGGETPLHRAVTRTKGDLLMTELLLKNGANPNLTTISGESPLHLALLTAPLKRKADDTTNFIVDMLLFHGADINARTSKQKTPLDIAMDNRLPGPTMAIKREKALREWLGGLELLNYITNFRQNRISVDQIEDLDEKMLVSMNIKDKAVQDKLLDNLDKVKLPEEVVFPLDLPSLATEKPRVARSQTFNVSVEPPDSSNKPHTHKQASEAVLMIRNAQLERHARVSLIEKEKEKDKPQPQQGKAGDRKGSGSNKKEKEGKKKHHTHLQGSSSEFDLSEVAKPRSKSVSITADAPPPESARARKRWEISLTEVSLSTPLGEGGAGAVFRGDWRGLPIALKRLKDQALRQDQVNMFIAEIDLMSELRHPHIIQFLGASLEPGNMFFITQLAEKGNLHDVTTKENPPFKQRVQFMRDVARGMNYLHQNNPPIMHRDLKSMNILIDENNKALICDFGISKQINGSKVTGKGALNGTFYWMAPDDKQTVKSDVYSYGLVMWEALTGEFPYANFKLSQLIINVHTKGERPPIPDGLHPDYKALLNKCWAHNPDERPCFPEILKSLDALLGAL